MINSALPRRCRHDRGMTTKNLRLSSLAVHAGRGDLAGLGVHALPIDLSSTNPLPDIDSGGLSYESMATGGLPTDPGGAVYARLWNPTVARFEEAMSELEHAEASVAFSSGMAALTAALLAVGHETGNRHVVAVRPLYGGTDHLLTSGILGTTVSFCSAQEVGSHLRRDTGLIVIETPANPTLELVDIAAVVDASNGVPVIVDNTFATPVLQNPLDHGATMVLHSATKYLGGHGDSVGGVISSSRGWAAPLRRTRAVTGALLHPLAAYLLHRGLPTLPLRVLAQQASAQRLAGWLGTHPSVEKVFYPDHGNDPQGVLGRQMRGTGAMLSVELRGGYAEAMRLTNSLNLITHAVSLGGVDTLIQHPAALTHRPVAAEARPSAGIVRISVGLEDVDDLISDLDSALAAAALLARVGAAR